MSGNNTFVFSAKRRGNNTPVVCKFFADEDGFRREMKFFERVHTGDFVPGQLLHCIPCYRASVTLNTLPCIADFLPVGFLHSLSVAASLKHTELHALATKQQTARPAARTGAMALAGFCKLGILGNTPIPACAGAAATASVLSTMSWLQLSRNPKGGGGGRSMRSHRCLNAISKSHMCTNTIINQYVLRLK